MISRNKGIKKIFFFLSVLCTVCCVLFTDASALDVKKTILKNGLTVLHVERHGLPIIMVTLLVKAGPVNETAAKGGLANLTAQLLTEGTIKRRANDISDEIEFIGAALNASVDNDYTTLNLSVLKKDAQKGFEVFSDVLLNPTFPANEIARNKNLIIGSLKQNEEDPSFVAEKAFKKAVFGDLSYGRLIRGSADSINNITREDIIKFYSAYYKPNNSIMSVVGDLTDKELEVLLNSFIAEWKASDIPKAAPFQKTEKSKKEIFIEKNITQANIIIGHAGIRREEPDYYAVSVMNYILGGGGFSSRLMEIIRDEKGLAYDVHSYFAPYKYGGFFEAGVQTKNESAGVVIAEILKQMKRIRQEPVSEKELEDARAYLTGSFPRKLETNRKIADFLCAVEFYGLGLDYIEKYPKYINSVSREDVLRVARKYLDPEKYILIVVADKAKARIEKEDRK